MNVDERLVREITQKVMAALAQTGNAVVSAPAPVNTSYSADGSSSVGNMTVTPVGDAQVGKYPDEVVVGLAPAFAQYQTKTICGLSHSDVLREIAAGIEEEGMKVRFIKVYETSDSSFIALKAAKTSGSGIGIGLQSKGTAVIHQRDLFPLTNLELFPQAPVLTLEIYRKIGKNAARYAKGQTPVPIETINDCMSRPKFQARAAILHIKETEHTKDGKVPVELDVRWQ